MIQLTKFQKAFIDHLDYKSMQNGFQTVYACADSDKKGHITFCEKADAYMLILADYAIPEDFSLSFTTNDCQLRFGLVYEGISEFKLDDKPATNFKPAPFLAIEDSLSGVQNWKKGQTYKGIEFFVDMTYLKKLSGAYPELDGIFKLAKNQAVLYLPLNVIDTLNILEQKLLSHTLTPLLLESLLLGCLASIGAEATNQSMQSYFMTALNREIQVSPGRVIQLSTEDIKAIHRAKILISENIALPPTIHELSHTLLISEQKLTSGFKALFHLTIGSYIKSYRLSKAANLLSSTDLSIEEITRLVGYSHPSNLGKAFKSKYKRTPSEYRRFRSKKST